MCWELLCRRQGRSSQRLCRKQHRATGSVLKCDHVLNESSEFQISELRYLTLSSSVPDLRKNKVAWELRLRKIKYWLTCIVTTRSSTTTSFVRKSAPIVALYWLEKRLFTYWFISDVFPTLESPKMMTFNRTFFLDDILITADWINYVRLVSSPAFLN